MTETPPRQIAAELVPKIMQLMAAEWQDHWPQHSKWTVLVYIAQALYAKAGLIGRKP